VSTDKLHMIVEKYSLIDTVLTK